MEHYFEKDHRGWYADKHFLTKYIADNDIQVAPLDASKREPNVNYFEPDEYKQHLIDEKAEYKQKCDDESGDEKYDAKYAKQTFEFFPKFPMLFCKMCANASAYRAVCQRKVGGIQNGILHCHVKKCHLALQKYAQLSIFQQILIKFF